MRKINTRDIPEDSWSSPKGKFQGASRAISEALGRKPQSTDLLERHPFDVEITRVPAGMTPCPFHSHAAQWEFYHVISGRGSVRDKDGTTAIEAGDSFVFPPEQPHQLLNDSAEDLVLFVVADNPIGESCHYPDSGKWLVRSPQRTLIRSEAIEYYDGEE
ncbi:MAG TPA: cupin domain-containing protein [Chthoniobacterales bacterium]|nr:cupin domain-containing protein [Chthoniobacterales bacterium]